MPNDAWISSVRSTGMVHIQVSRLVDVVRSQALEPLSGFLLTETVQIQGLDLEDVMAQIGGLCPVYIAA
jgi:hypothetical protein